MAKSKLTAEQKLQLVQWLAADFTSDVIRYLANKKGWDLERFSNRVITYYRRKHEQKIIEAREQRHSDAMSTGLALKEERVAQLKEDAAHLEIIKWMPDNHGRLVNEKAWREVLEQIAEEVGDRNPLKDQPISEIIVRFVGKNRERDALTDNSRASRPESRDGANAGS